MLVISYLFVFVSRVKRLENLKNQTGMKRAVRFWSKKDVILYSPKVLKNLLTLKNKIITIKTSESKIKSDISVVILTVMFLSHAESVGVGRYQLT